jgi:hypothetical protein
VKLREHLRSHFEQEEAGGYMEESIARVPRLAAAVKAVLGDHPVLLVELDRLIELLAVPEGSPAFWERVDRGYEGFARHLVAHEKSENAVVQEGYNEDLGLV